MGRAAVSLSTGLDDPERVTVALLVAIRAAESGWRSIMFLTGEAVRLANEGAAADVECGGFPPVAELLKRYEAAGGEFLVCPRGFASRGLDEARLLANAALGGVIPLWEWVDESTAVFSY